MPFDGVTNPKIEALLRLIDALRADMPPTFRWNFCSWLSQSACGTAGCACGLAQHIGIVPDLFENGVLVSTVVGRAIGVNANTARRIFNPQDVLLTYGVEKAGDVTPQMVADKLERLPLSAK